VSRGQSHFKNGDVRPGNRGHCSEHHGENRELQPNKFHLFIFALSTENTASGKLLYLNMSLRTDHNFDMMQQSLISFVKKGLTPRLRTG
jgi:hypothetical protein